MKRIAILGAKGQLGRSLLHIIDQQQVQYDITSLDAGELDISNAPAVRQFFGNNNPFDIIINCAAYTAVDKAETEVAQAFAVNYEGPEHLVQFMPTSCIFIHISTDFVFDGQKEGAYTETDETQPLGVYGKSKEKGEQALLSSPKSTYIFRTAWLYSPYGHNFLKTMQKLGSNRPSLNVVDDQFGCPTSSIALAEVIIQLIAKDKQWLKQFENPNSRVGDPSISYVLWHFLQRSLEDPKIITRSKTNKKDANVTPSKPEQDSPPKSVQFSDTTPQKPTSTQSSTKKPASALKNDPDAGRKAAIVNQIQAVRKQMNDKKLAMAQMVGLASALEPNYLKSKNRLDEVRS